LLIETYSRTVEGFFANQNCSNTVFGLAIYLYLQYSTKNSMVTFLYVIFGKLFII
jgi:hypothetical protein